MESLYNNIMKTKKNRMENTKELILESKLEEQKTTNSKYKNLELKIIDWAREKGILEKATPLKQAEKTLEEVKELIEALEVQEDGLIEFYNFKGKLVNTEYEIKDALGDILVTIIIQAKMQGLELEDCLESAYNIISKRTGKMVDGQFLKDE